MQLREVLLKKLKNKVSSPRSTYLLSSAYLMRLFGPGLTENDNQKTKKKKSFPLKTALDVLLFE